MLVFLVATNHTSYIFFVTKNVTFLIICRKYILLPLMLPKEIHFISHKQDNIPKITKKILM